MGIRIQNIGLLMPFCVDTELLGERIATSGYRPPRNDTVIGTDTDFSVIPRAVRPVGISWYHPSNRCAGTDIAPGDCHVGFLNQGMIAPGNHCY